MHAKSGVLHLDGKRRKIIIEIGYKLVSYRIGIKLTQLKYRESFCGHDFSLTRNCRN